MADPHPTNYSEGNCPGVLADTLPITCSAQHCCRVQADTLTEYQSEPIIHLDVVPMSSRQQYSRQMFVTQSLYITPMKKYIPHLIVVSSHAQLLWDVTISVSSRARTAALRIRRSQYPRHDFAVIFGRVDRYVMSFALYTVRLDATSRLQRQDSCAIVRFYPQTLRGGGIEPENRTSKIWSHTDLQDCVPADTKLSAETYRFVRYGSSSVIARPSDGCLLINVPLSKLAPRVSKKVLLQMCVLHQIVEHSTRSPVDALRELLAAHTCDHCIADVSEFRPRVLRDTKSVRDQRYYQKTTQKIASVASSDASFPPSPPTDALLENIATGFANGQSLDVIGERACSVCGLLTPNSALSDINLARGHLDVLQSSAEMVTRKERSTSSDRVEPIPGPVLLPNCADVCPTCLKSLKADNGSNQCQ